VYDSCYIKAINCNDILPRWAKLPMTEFDNSKSLHSGPEVRLRTRSEQDI